MGVRLVKNIFFASHSRICLFSPQSTNHSKRTMQSPSTRFALYLIISLILFTAVNCPAEETWTEDFRIATCTFSSVGRNEYFILEPGYQLTLQGVEDEETTVLIITVLNETKLVGSVETRIVEERESVNGKLIEVSRNYFAFCTQTNTAFYFGEDVDMYKDGKITGHEGAWQADSAGASAGVMMPGLALLGARYYQEMAPGIAMDRAEIVTTTETVKTPAGAFQNCLKTKETTPLEPKAIEYKFYAPGIGLIRDDDLLLSKYGVLSPEK
jgi:hypothetical protein